MIPLDAAVSAILALRDADPHTFGQITGRDAKRIAEAVLAEIQKSPETAPGRTSDDFRLPS